MAARRDRRPPRHARQPRPRIRYQRMTAVLLACGITLVAVLGGVGVLPGPATKVVVHSEPGAGGSERAALTVAAPADPDPVTVGDARFSRSDQVRRRLAAAALAVPPDSGDGRRVVFDQGAQRVWLVGEDGEVRRTYLVSGSREDNLAPGSYEVYSRSERAWGIDDGGTMKFMVRFTYGQRAAIGFHDIPYKEGRLVQSRDELGTPLSSGCVRQWRPDARALWRFAPLGTPVVVVA